jgi:hypothetical protein
MTCLATDSAGQVYVGGSQNISGTTTYTWEVMVYAAGASGNATPVRTVIGSGSSFLTVSEMAVDSAGLLYVLTNRPAPMVAVLSATANGAATPVRMITGAATQLGGNPLGIAVDISGTIYVSNTGALGTASVLAFPSTANGNVAPARVISGSNTGFHALYGIATDATGNVYVLDTLEVPAVSANSSIYEFPPAANGNVAPSRTIAGSNTGMSSTFTSYLQVDSAGTIFVSGDRGTNTPFVASYGAGASGNVTPSTTFTSSVWYGVGYYGIALR